ncbi:hypothetical protein XFF6166_230024 [Xanthomonas citri pv. fuscans]|uniref:Uncharacterized protein n=1 Tax=Xanthomonas citri pv. citri TaxID=611301 RepID=A0A0U5FIC6_XANCI|nr:hypothetical protein XAC3824_110206 [Xanthomonas citri pv. citri]SON77484.1 hypothetical protein XFF6166_230024 [Xanthomonas citri pv. fuscans]CEE16783.1 hypothetical protein XAC1083_100202 [Xanthomonas citri pv. citri]CEE17769.1 hypothetical protein XAC902_100207 [Xanthomonas citri pv. citri]CEE22542.1 hypothetical protein XAC2911_100018 [Xanthomonas citri pv. citri]
MATLRRECAANLEIAGGGMNALDFHCRDPANTQQLRLPRFASPLR